MYSQVATLSANTIVSMCKISLSDGKIMKHTFKTLIKLSKINMILCLWVCTIIFIYLVGEADKMLCAGWHFMYCPYWFKRFNNTLALILDPLFSQQDLYVLGWPGRTTATAS